MKSNITPCVLLTIVLLINQVSKAATCTANLIGGNWNNPATWDCGVVPGCGDVIVIPLGSIVTVSADVDYSACPDPMMITVTGTLLFTKNKDLRLPVNSCLDVSLLGTVIPSVALGSTNNIFVGLVKEWIAGPLTLPVIGPAAFGCDFPISLPVILNGFEIENSETEVQLNWKTSSERDNDYFLIEVSRDGSFYQELGTVKGGGNSASELTYQFSDNNPFQGTSYYRLKQVDFSGKVETLSMMSNEYSSYKYLVYPVPANKQLYLEGKKLESSKVQIYEAKGLSVDIPKSFEDERYSFDLADVADGVYFLVIENNQVRNTERIVVVHK